MIEVEQKFQLQPEDRERLLEGATYVSTQVMHDQYWDTAEAKLIAHETFLRYRDGRFELKVPLHRLTKELPKSYHFEELDDEGVIRQRLGLPAGGELAADLKTAGYGVVADYTTTRTKYRHPPFTLDFDETDFGFQVLEIERTFERETDREAAAQSILEFANRFGLPIVHVRGKIHEYLKAKRSDLWTYVQAAWASWPER